MSDAFVSNVECRFSGGPNQARHFTPCHSSSDSAEVGRWAEAFQKHVLARHDAVATNALPNIATATTSPSEQHPSRRPRPCSTTAFKATMTTTTTTTNTHDSRNGSRSQSQSQPQSTLASPTPRSVHTAASSGEGSDGSDNGVLNGLASPRTRVMASRTVSAVAVHPPLSRGPRRAAMVPAAAQSASLQSTASSVGLTAATGAVEEKLSPRALAAPPAPQHPADSAAAVEYCFSASATASPIRSAPVQTHITPHARFISHKTNSNGSSGRARSLSHLQLQNQWAGTVTTGSNGGSSPVNSAATLHIPCDYRSSPFFQRVNINTSTSPMVHASSDEAAAAVTAMATSATLQTGSPPAENTPQVSMAAAQDDSCLLQEVTPITHGGGSSRHDSQLPSQLREMQKAAAVRGGGYFGTFENHVRSGDVYTDLPGNSLTTGCVSQLHPPLPLSLSVTMPASSAGDSSSATGVGGMSTWDTNNHSASAFGQQTSPYEQGSSYYPPGYTVEERAAAQGKPPFVGFTSPPYTPADVTRLSSSPGGLSGSHNATLSTTAYPQSGMASMFMMPSHPPSGAMANYQQALLSRQRQQQPEQQSPYLYYGASVGGASSYFHNSVPCSNEMPYGGASPLDFRPQHLQQQQRYHHLHFQSPSPSQCYYAVVGRCGDNNSGTGYSPVPTVSGTTVTTTAAIACGLSGVALEKQLLHATKEELVQILLELGSCNPEASRFIDAKAFFFAFRHEHSHFPTPAAPVVMEAAAVFPADTNDSRSGSHNNSVNDEKNKETKALQNESMVRSLSVVKAGENTKASNHSIARCIFPADAAEGEEDEVADGGCDTAADAAPTAQAATTASPSEAERGISSVTATAAAVASNLLERRGRPEERAFCADIHPCLRWYGACRNATSCAYAGLPRNLCLNWVRGACVARTECSGVHRLPDPCPPELQRIYLLNHGLSRCRAECTLHALSVASSAATAGQMKRQQTQCQISTTAFEAALGTTTGDIGTRTGFSTKEVSNNNNGDGTLQTPRNQSIHRDTYVGCGYSTPHRHPNHHHYEHQQHNRHGELDDTANSKTQTALSPWSAMDVDTNEADIGVSCNAGSYLQGLRIRGVVSPADSSCSTVEDRMLMSDSVSRCLSVDFDSTWTLTCPTATTDDDAVPTGVTANAINSVVLSHRADIVLALRAGCRSPVVMTARDMKEPTQITPLCSVAAEARRCTAEVEAAGKEDEEYFVDAAAPAAGTRTRMQSPSYM